MDPDESKPKKKTKFIERVRGLFRGGSSSAGAPPSVENSTPLPGVSPSSATQVSPPPPAEYTPSLTPSVPYTPSLYPSAPPSSLYPSAPLPSPYPSAPLPSLNPTPPRSSVSSKVGADIYRTAREEPSFANSNNNNNNVSGSSSSSISTSTSTSSSTARVKVPTKKVRVAAPRPSVADSSSSSSNNNNLGSSSSHSVADSLSAENQKGRVVIFMPFTREQARAPDPAGKEQSVELFAQQMETQLKLRNPRRNVTICYAGDPPIEDPLTAKDTVYVMGHGTEGVGALDNAAQNALINAQEIRNEMDRQGLTKGVGKIKLFSCHSADKDGDNESLLHHFRNTGFPRSTEITGYKGNLLVGVLDSMPRKISNVEGANPVEVRASQRAVHKPARGEW